MGVGIGGSHEGEQISLLHPLRPLRPLRPLKGSKHPKGSKHHSRKYLFLKKGSKGSKKSNHARALACARERGLKLNRPMARKESRNG